MRSLRKEDLQAFLTQLHVAFSPDDTVENLRRLAANHLTTCDVAYDAMPFIVETDRERFRPLRNPTPNPTLEPHPSTPVSAGTPQPSEALASAILLLVRSQAAQQEAMMSRLAASSGLSSQNLSPFLLECQRAEIRFGGAPTERVDVFLRRLEQLRRIHPLSDADLLTIFPALLQGACSNWFEAVRSGVSTFGELTRLLREVYLPSDYEHRTRRDLFLRTQLPGEKTDHFLAVLANANSVLSSPFTESELVGIAAHNLHPTFHRAVASQSFNTLNDLAQVCRRVEAAEALSREYAPPPRRLLEDPLFLAPGMSQPSTANHPQRLEVCHRCHRPGHFARDCRVGAVIAGAEEEAPPPPHGFGDQPGVNYREGL